MLLKYVSLLALVLIAAACATTPPTTVTEDSAQRNPASGYMIDHYPILEAVQHAGGTLAPETLAIMEKWRGLNLEDSAYEFGELGGSTSIKIGIRKVDRSEPKGYKKLGSFTPRNGAGNPNTGIAYFNLAAILGYDRIIRPGVRYEGGPRTMQAMKSGILNSSIHGRDRLENRDRILNYIKSGVLKGYVQGGKPNGLIAYNAIVNSGAGPNGAPRSGHPIILALQASNPKPKAGTPLTLASGYTGDALELAREYSVLMTLDAVLGQWDRYSGDNLCIFKDDAGHAHFYGCDNDGADIGTATGWVDRNLGWFSRYDHGTIDKLKEIYAFLQNPAKGYLGYTDAQKFIVDLGLYFELPPATYVERIKRNLEHLFAHVSYVEGKYPAGAYLD